MTSERRNRRIPKSINYIIGASTLLLALMLFSELSCSLLGLCTNWFPPARILGFWEVMGISSAGLLGALSVRFLRKNRDTKASSPTLSDSSVPKWQKLFNQLTEEEKKSLKNIMEEQGFRSNQNVTPRQTDPRAPL